METAQHILMSLGLDASTLVTLTEDVRSFCGVSSTLGVWCCCGVCSTLEVMLEDCVDCSTQGELSQDSLSSALITLSILLYSVFILIFWIANELLPKSLDAGWLTSLTFFDFKSRIVLTNKRNSGSLQKKFLVFSLSFSLYKAGWALQRCTDNPDSKSVENVQWWHLTLKYSTVFLRWESSTVAFMRTDGTGVFTN